MLSDAQPGFFERIVRQLKRLCQPGKPVDPTRFGDPVALKTEWNPAKGGGTSFRTHRLVQIGPDRMEFRPTWGWMLFCGIFLLFGLTIALLTLDFRAFSRLPRVSPDNSIPFWVGMLFVGIGGGMMCWGSRPRVFDRRLGFFWKGRFFGDSSLKRGYPKKMVRLEEIHALQILAEWCSGGDPSCYSYELNLVRRDGQRLNVVDHGDLTRLREEAKRLAEFLDVKIWDAA